MMLSAAAVSSSARTPGTEEIVQDPRITAVETSLIEVASPEALFERRADATEAARFTLSERMVHHKVPGVGIAVIEDGEIAWAKGYGVLSADEDDPVTTESLFEAASTSKFATAVLLLHFVEKGVFDLDTDVNEYLTSWKVPDTEFTLGQKVTLRLILTHRAGLPTTDCEDTTQDEAPSVPEVLTGRPVAGNEPATPVRPLGDEWVYSNLGCIMIQLILEDTLGRPFPELMREVVLEPVGMSSSTVEYPLPPELADRETMPHDGDGVAHEPLMNYTAFGHAGLMTTPTDLALLFVDVMRSYQGEPDGVLSPEMARAFLTPCFDIEPSPFGLPTSEGLGVFLRGGGNASMFFHPGGNTPGANSFPFALPEVGKGAVIMTNGLNGQVLFMEILAAIMEEYDWPR
jgi:CubicO group peptidase (beta-lactamase class C family)